MHLFVVRHAIAEDARPGQDDASRELTAEGVRKFRRVVRGLRQLDWQLDRVLTSPWARALHTAELLAPISDEPPIATTLLCDHPRPELLALIAEATPTTRKRSATAVVGHEPWLGRVVALLAGGGVQLAGRVGFFLRVDDFDAHYRRMAAAGVAFVAPPRDEPYGRLAVFLDLAGNRWDLLGPRSSERPEPVTPA